MTAVASPGQPILICFDGSQESQRAVGTVANMLTSTTAVVLTVWQPLTARLAESGGFGAFAFEDESEVDEREQAAAGETAEDGAVRAREIGMEASARTEQSDETVWQAIVRVADEIDAGLIVCGTRGRGSVRSALLGSVSHALIQHAGRPVLVSPDPRQ